MQSFPRMTALGALFLLFLVGPAEAQYMKITTDNPADSGRLKSTGTTILTITLNTNHDRDGSLQTCNSHTAAAGCGASSTGSPLDLLSYTITLVARGGTVDWGTFVAADPSFQPLGPDLANDTQTEINRFATGAFTPAGLITLGSIPVTITGGAPSIEIAHGTQTIDIFGFGTGFGTLCDGFMYSNSYILGDPAFVCASGDWFDVDGAAAPAEGTGTCPISFPGGIYNGLVRVPLMFDGTASLDPDGDPLTYAWDFDSRDGIGVDATGATPSHTYTAFGSYIVTLTVTDVASPSCSSTATTFAYIYDFCDVTIFNGYDPIRMGTGRSWFTFVQPTSDCYVNSDVVLSSFTLTMPGRGSARADVKKTSVVRDQNGDGIQEIQVTFSKDELQKVFAGLQSGTYLVSIGADLVNGGKIRGVKYVQIVRGGSFSEASISPNPLNPEATLTYTTSRQGFVRIDMFDIQGRLVRRLVDASSVAVGTHQVKIDGRSDRGEKLSSGAYYIRGTSSDGEFRRLVTILK